MVQLRRSLYTTIKKTRPMAPNFLPKNTQLNTKFITMDLETVSNLKDNESSILTPYLLCWHDGVKCKNHSYFIDPSLGENSIKDIIYRATCFARIFVLGNIKVIRFTNIILLNSMVIS